MKKKYSPPEVKMIRLSHLDLIATSSPIPIPGPLEWEEESDGDDVG